VSVTWFDSVTITVEAALSAATGSYGAWDSAVWDTSTWGPDVVWTDISAYVMGWGSTRAFGREVQAWNAGTASLTLNNNDGRFSPSNLSGPYVTGGITGIRPWRPIRIRASYAGTTYSVFTGYATAWTEQFHNGPSGGYVTVEVPCVDELGRLAGFDGFEQGSQGSGELSGVRIHRILDNAGHTGVRSVDEGVNTLQATTLAQNAVTELKLTADSEGGALFIDDDGTVVFEDQLSLVNNTRSNTTQATFGDSTGELGYTQIESAYDGDLVVNMAAFARVGGTQQQAADNTSRALYGDRQESRTDLIAETDAQVLGLAELAVAVGKNPELRFTAFTVGPRGNPATLFPQVLGRKVRDRVTVVRRPPGGHTITRDCFIAGVSHQVTPSDWSTTFTLSSATAWEFALWDDALWDDALFYV
jgi:hypothetical protein